MTTKLRKAHESAPRQFPPISRTDKFGSFNSSDEAKIHPAHDPVHRPSHYTSGDVECFDAIRAATIGLTGIEGFLVGQVIKYVWRFDKKSNPAEDLEKASWYLRRLLAGREK
jgi:hypothetical protein